MASDRGDNLATTAKVREKLEKLYREIENGFAAQITRANEIKDNWSMFRCELGPKQLFYGRNQLYAPLVYDAVRARATRFTNQLFPQNGRHVECVSTDGSLPRAALAVCEHHIDKTGLRELTPALCIAGDVEGQYNVYVEWQDSKRYTTRRVKKPVQAIEGLDTDEVDDIEEEEVSTGGPLVETISDADICIVPATAATTDDALAQGGSVTIIRRWNKHKIKQAIKNKEIDKKAGEALLDNMDKKDDGFHTDPDKAAASAAGVKKDGRGEWALVYETWTNLEVEEKERLCQVFFASVDNILMARRNPLWCDKLPLLSVPVQRQPGSAKGQPPVSAVADLQYYGNDILNEAADASNYALLPILKRDPEAATAPLVLSPGAIWDVAPGQVDVLTFPPIWKEGFEILADLQSKIMQTLSVSPAMITQGPQKLKKNQAEIAQQQQVEMLTTADAVRVLEEGILTPLVSLFLDMDYQYRDAKMMARQYGQMGMSAVMEEIPPLQNDTRFTTRWVGVEVARSAQQIQQKITALGVMRALPPAMYPDYTLDAQSVIVDIVESAFGPQQARLVLKDQRSQLSADPVTENKMMDEGLPAEVHPMDDDGQHIQVHRAALMTEGDLNGLKQIHLNKHVQQAMMKIIAQKQALSPQGGKGGGQPNQTPPGAQPRGPEGMQAPAGSIPQDQLKDPNVMPRQM